MAVTLWKAIDFVVSSSIGVAVVLPQLWMMGFFGNYSLVPITVDSSPEWHDPPRIGPSPLFNNLFLITLFTVPHSSMIRGPLKKLIASCLPEDYYRQLYGLVSAIMLSATFYFWQPMTTVVWAVTNDTLAWVITGVGAAGWCLTLYSLITLDILAVFGLKDPLYRLMEWKQQPPKLLDSGIYGIMRHPVYTGLMIGYWAAPTMTVGHLLLTCILSVYIVLATTFLEERDLIKLFGDEYVRYQQKTSMFFPIPFMSSSGGTKKH